MTRKIHACGHRGHCVDRPEQTMLAYTRALELGADILELDVRLSADHQLVVIHDATLERTSNGRGSVRYHSLKALQNLDAGSWFNPRFDDARVPTLSAVLSTVGTTNPICMEIKSDGHGSEIASALGNFLADEGVFARHVVSSFDYDVLSSLKNVYSEIRLVPWMPEDCAADLARDIGSLKQLGAEAMFHTASLLTRDYVRTVQALGYQVWVWCDTSDEEIRNAVSLEPDVISCGDVSKVRTAIDKSSRL